MVVLGLGFLVAGLPVGARAVPALDRSSAAVRDKNPTQPADSSPASSTTAPARGSKESGTSTTTSTAKGKPTTTTADTTGTTPAPTPARTQSPQIDLPTTSTTVMGPASRAPSGSPGPVPGAPRLGQTPHPTPTTAVAPGTGEAGRGESVPVPALGQAGTTTTTAVSEPVVGEIGQDQGAQPGPAPKPTTKRPARALSRTGAPADSLLVLAGITLLLGAVAVGFGQPNSLAAAGAYVPGTVRGWQSGVPLAPERRERARQQMQRRRPRP